MTSSRVASGLQAGLAKSLVVAAATFAISDTGISFATLMADAVCAPREFNMEKED